MLSSIQLSHLDSRKIIDLGNNEKAWIIGTIYCEMKLKPNILNELVHNTHSSQVDSNLMKFTNEDDIYVVEDESARIELSGEILKNEKLVTGVTCGLFGFQDEDGKFNVSDISFPKLQPQSNISCSDIWVALISGLNLGNPSSMNIKLQLLIDYLDGELGTHDDQQENCNLTRVVFAGNTLSKPKFVEHDLEEKKTKRFGNDYTPLDTSPIKTLDSYLKQLSTSMSVDIMPGINDPTTTTLPQQPINTGLFPKSSPYETFNTVTNPYMFELEGVSFLGTSGQNIDDIFRCSNMIDRLEICEKTLLWGHICPTAPDTLWCYPFKDDDPFILKQKPHVYFVGNQPSFETRVVEDELGSKTRIILVPSFDETKTFVLLNCNTLECKSITILDEIEEKIER
ncbi:DNA polymerase delta subunit 2 [Clydaea vesicula]|uniref:DNA polymerase delta subunit 2 n=1 Tax=Clydaea vesicula TaxID=447962 RepID=A0AAD5U8C9_9FUNG|nr:DNA polymerase delta subunit 2 [Clydaea vesicula]KAJ3397509.1 DNA polymerase delta subunit 2 [Lobulomyces angularis]